MEDLKSLERFLRTEEEKSHRSQLGTVFLRENDFDHSCFATQSQNKMISVCR